MKTHRIKKPMDPKYSPSSSDAGKQPLKKRRGDKGAPQHDVYCRGCHARPSYNNRATYLCVECWEHWGQVWRDGEVLSDDQALIFKDQLTEFIKSRGRYVWNTEVFLNLKPVGSAELKRHNIKVAVTCRELGLYAPADDRITREAAERIEVFVTGFMEMHNRHPKVTEVLKGAKVDHTTLWSCMDYEAYIKGLGGMVKTDMRHRFRSSEDFLEAAANVVRKAGCPLHMTVILDGIGMSYPAYLDHFDFVSPEEIHDKAGIPRVLDGVDSLHEEAARRALNQLGWEVVPGVSFEGLTGDSGRPLKFDLALTDLKILVEVDDEQHLVQDHFMSKPTIPLYDEMKNQFARDNGYRLVHRFLSDCAFGFDRTELAE